MQKNNIEYFITNKQSEKPLKVVIKGIPIDYTSEEVQEELKSLGFPVEKVARLRRFKDRRPLPILQIQLTMGPGVDKIYDLTSFHYLTVTVEKFAKSGRVSQCFRCQSFFHSSENCRYKPKCVKCAGEHESKDCSKPRDTDATCVNCHGPHPANYRGCPKFPKWDKKQPNNNSNARQNLPNASNPPQRPRNTTQTRTQNRPQSNENRQTARTFPRSSYIWGSQTDDLEFPPMPQTQGSSTQNQPAPQDNTFAAFQKQLDANTAMLNSLTELIKNLTKQVTLLQETKQTGQPQSLVNDSA